MQKSIAAVLFWYRYDYFSLSVLLGFIQRVATTSAQRVHHQWSTRFTSSVNNQYFFLCFSLCFLLRVHPLFESNWYRSIVVKIDFSLLSDDFPRPSGMWVIHAVATAHSAPICPSCHRWPFTFRSSTGCPWWFVDERKISFVFSSAYCHLDFGTAKPLDKQSISTPINRNEKRVGAPDEVKGKEMEILWPTEREVQEGELKKPQWERKQINVSTCARTLERREQREQPFRRIGTRFFRSAYLVWVRFQRQIPGRSENETTPVLSCFGRNIHVLVHVAILSGSTVSIVHIQTRENDGCFYSDWTTGANVKPIFA